MKDFKTVICGGTFDLFHKGHREFLKFAIAQANKIIIGITSDAYIEKNKEGHPTNSFDIRKKAVEEFLEKENANFQLVEISDIYGPTIDSSFNLDALVVTEDSKKGAQLVNEKRKELGLSQLRVVIFPLVETEYGPISSTLIRKGLVNREGRSYENKKWLSQVLYLPEELRNDLRKPLGKVVKEIPEGLDPSQTVTVGDIVTATHNKANFMQKISIVDLMVKRERVYKDLNEHNFPKDTKIFKINNPAGSLTPHLFSAVKEAFNFEERAVIQVDGEEDLAVLPVIIYSPLGYVILYGQPEVGMVVIRITEQEKEYAYSIISKFSQNL